MGTVEVTGFVAGQMYAKRLAGVAGELGGEEKD